MILLLFITHPHIYCIFIIYYLSSPYFYQFEHVTIWHGRYVLIMYNNQRIYEYVTGKNSKTHAGDEDAVNARDDHPEAEEEANMNDSRFRASLLTLMTTSKSLGECAGIAMVTKITGSVEHVFKKYDKDNSGSIDKDELKAVFHDLGCEVTEVRYVHTFF